LFEIERHCGGGRLARLEDANRSEIANRAWSVQPNNAKNGTSVRREYRIRSTPRTRLRLENAGRVPGSNFVRHAQSCVPVHPNGTDPNSATISRQENVMMRSPRTRPKFFTALVKEIDDRVM